MTFIDVTKMIHHICIVLLNFHTELELADSMVPRYGEFSTCIPFLSSNQKCQSTKLDKGISTWT